MPGIMCETDGICLYVTEKCNSNCIMCPMSLNSRERGQTIKESEWEQLESFLIRQPEHITITGGEPFLEYEHIFWAMELINRICPHTEVLILTNGRALSLSRLYDQVKVLLTDRYTLAIPIHAPISGLHDQISQSKGSFVQSMRALSLLSETAANIEVRVVGHKLNLTNLTATFQMLADSGLRIDIINLIAMEMMGCAARNRSLLWCDYQEVCKNAEKGILYAIEKGINVGLYNFPLCTIPHNMWSLSVDSITKYKVRYDKQCEKCNVKSACGGMFFSTYELGLCKIEPIGGDQHDSKPEF